MSKENLPEKIDPYRSADQAIHLYGEMPIDQMMRLAPSLHQRAGSVTVDFQFGVDEQQVRFMRASYAARLVLNCQRCMKPFDYEMTGDFLSGLVHSDEEVAGLPKAYDPLVVQDNSLELAALIEEEILINLPIVPMHESEECDVKLPYVMGSAAEEDPGKENPFKVIESLRGKK